MVGWIIFGSILLILILALVQSVKVTVIYDANPEITVKLLCFTIVKIPADPKTLEKKKRKQQKKEERERKKQAAQAKKAEKSGKKAEITAADKEEDKAADDTEKPAETGTTESSKKSGSAKKEKAAKKMPALDFGMIMDYVRSASPPIKRLFRKIRIRDVYVDWVAGSDEAGKTALKYGGLCTAFYSLQEWLTTYFDAKIGEINIEADFEAEKDDIFIYLTLKLRICTALGCVLWLGVRMLKTYLRYNSKPKQKTKHKPVKMRSAA